MPLGIKFTLDTPRVENTTTDGFEVIDATFDFVRGQIVIAFDRLDDQGNVMQRERAITLDGQDAQNALDRAQQIATNQGQTVIRALYYVLTERVRDHLGFPGTIEIA